MVFVYNQLWIGESLIFNRVPIEENVKNSFHVKIKDLVSTSSSMFKFKGDEEILKSHPSSKEEILHFIRLHNLASVESNMVGTIKTTAFMILCKIQRKIFSNKHCQVEIKKIQVMMNYEQTLYP